MFNNAVESELIALESVRNEIFHFNILFNIQNTHRELCSAEQTICSWSYRSRPIKFTEENCFNDSALFFALLILPSLQWDCVSKPINFEWNCNFEHLQATAAVHRQWALLTTLLMCPRVDVLWHSSCSDLLCSPFRRSATRRFWFWLFSPILHRRLREHKQRLS